MYEYLNGCLSTLRMLMADATSNGDAELMIELSKTILAVVSAREVFH